jgi:hypothetical protein
MVKKRASWTSPDIERLVADLQVSDEIGNGHTVRALCPCHVGWEVFEQNVGFVLRQLRHRSRVVRAHALHVFEDAATMQAAGDLRYYLEPGEEKIGEKRACSRYRSMEERLEARRDRKIRKLKRRHRRVQTSASN